MSSRSCKAETGSEFRARLVCEGRWEEYLVARQELQDGGMARRPAGIAARVQFPPLDVNGTPVVRVEDPGKSLRELRARGGEGAASVSSATPGVTTVGGESPDQPGTGRRLRLGDNPNAVSKADQPSHWGGEIDMYADFQFVWSNLEVSELSPSDAPSAGAWSWLLDARKDRPEFRRQAAKFMPSRAELDRALEHKDDGSTILDLIRQVRDSD